MDQVRPAGDTEPQGILAERVVRAGRDERRQGIAFRLVLEPDRLRRIPVGALLLRGNPGGAERCLPVHLARADRIRANDPQLAWLGGRVVVKAVLGQVDHDPLARGIRQQKPTWNHHFGARSGEPGVDSGVCGDDFLVADAMTPADVEQRVLVLGHRDADRADHVVAIERQQEFACPDVFGDEQCQRCDQRSGEPLADSDTLHATFLQLPASILATWRRSTRCSHALTRTRHRP